MTSLGPGKRGYGLAEPVLAERLSRLVAATDAQPKRGLAENGLSGAKNPEIRSRLAEARRVFAGGFQAALFVPKDRLHDLFRDMAGRTRGFALEGGAMGSTLLDEFSGLMEPERLSRLRGERTGAERFMIGLGAGMAGARLGKPIEWVPVGLGPRESRAIADGYGFHHAFFSARRFRGRGFALQPGRWGSHYDVGLGRGLFFAAEGDPEVIAAVVEDMPPDRRGSLWRGIGTASAFTGAGAGRSDEPGPGRFDSDYRVGVKAGLQMASRLARGNEGGTAA